MRLTSAASVVLISSQILPEARPARMPSWLSITSAQAAGEGRQVMMTSTFSAISRGDDAREAPFARKRDSRSAFKSRTVSSSPWRARLAASLPPTLPKPMKPILLLCI